MKQTIPKRNYERPMTIAIVAEMTGSLLQHSLGILPEGVDGDTGDFISPTPPDDPSTGFDYGQGTLPGGTEGGTGDWGLGPWD